MEVDPPTQDSNSLVKPRGKRRLILEKVNGNAAREQSIADGLKMIAEDGLSQQEAARRTGIPAKTLSNRRQGRKSRSEAHVHQQLLPPGAEQALIKEIDTWSRRYVPLRAFHLVEDAQYLFKELYGYTRDLGRSWKEGFIGRHPQVNTTKSKSIDEKRVMAKNPEYLHGLFDEVRLYLLYVSKLNISCRESSSSPSTGSSLSAATVWMRRV